MANSNDSKELDDHPSLASDKDGAVPGSPTLSYGKDGAVPTTVREPGRRFSGMQR